VKKEDEKIKEIIEIIEYKKIIALKRKIEAKIEKNENNKKKQEESIIEITKKYMEKDESLNAIFKNEVDFNKTNEIIANEIVNKIRKISNIEIIKSKFDTFSSIKKLYVLSLYLRPKYYQEFYELFSKIFMGLEKEEEEKKEEAEIAENNQRIQFLIINLMLNISKPTIFKLIY